MNSAVLNERFEFNCKAIRFCFYEVCEYFTVIVLHFISISAISRCFSSCFDLFSMSLIGEIYTPGASFGRFRVNL